jgi:PKD repeat protein
MKRSMLIISLLLLCINAKSQETKRVLFLGNSYTGVNNLPQMVANVAQSLGDSLVFDSNTPGGYTFQGHTTNATSQNKIAQGGWDYVVLQEQSQLPSFPYSQFSAQSLPYAIILTNQIRAADSCAKPLFYMTWGRKNGDQSNCASNPPVCTYAGMQHLLRERYLLMGDTTNAEVAPVGAVWRDVRANNPSIELYQTDESHPSLEGSYLAACTFYASIFHKSPVGAAPAPTMWAMDAIAIQQQATATVFDSLGAWKIDTLTPRVNFTWTQVPPNCEILFDASISQAVDSVYWDFGDGSNASGMQVTHLYPTLGTYFVCVEGWKGCSLSDTCDVVLTCVGSLSENNLKGISIYPNPATSKLRVERFNQAAINARYKIYNLQGAVLAQGDDASVIDVSRLAIGMYVLEVEIGGAFSRQSFVKR